MTARMRGAGKGSAGPNLLLERKVEGRVCGVDEAGRGPLAGPVVAAAVILDPERLPAGIDDSKKLTPTRREALYDAIRGSAIASAVALADVAEIERLNILQATMLAMRRAVEQLSPAPAFALIDGNRLPSLPCPAEAVIGGDARSLSIAAASILAKVTRDRIMREIAGEYPGYGFENHMGYGTPAHLEALNRLGPTPHHRLGFAPVRDAQRIVKSLNPKSY